MSGRRWMGPMTCMANAWQYRRVVAAASKWAGGPVESSWSKLHVKANISDKYLCLHPLIIEMDRVPFEIWATISSHACTDSGSTGRNLSLVSRLIRDASAPVKLQSIAAHGTEQLVALHKLLLTTPAHLRRTRYLFLSEKSLGAD